jgi:hypothetical protein
LLLAVITSPLNQSCSTRKINENIACRKLKRNFASFSLQSQFPNQNKRKKSKKKFNSNKNSPVMEKKKGSKALGDLPDNQIRIKRLLQDLEREFDFLLNENRERKWENR